VQSHLCQKLLQHGGSELAAAAAAMGRLVRRMGCWLKCSLFLLYDTKDVQCAAPFLRFQRVACLSHECGMSMTVNGSVHSRTRTPPAGTVRRSFLARSTGCGQFKPRRSSTVSLI